MVLAPAKPLTGQDFSLYNNITDYGMAMSLPAEGTCCRSPLCRRGTNESTAITIHQDLSQIQTHPIFSSCLEA